MATAEIDSGICGFKTVVTTHMEGDLCRLNIQSGCKSIQKMAQSLREVDPFREISYRRGQPLVLQEAALSCPHAACPVAVGIIKAIEVEAGLALPKDASIKISK